MKSFSDWLKTPVPPAETKTLGQAIRESLPPGLYVEFQVSCCVCDKRFEFPLGTEDYDENEEYYCGGSPYCSP